MRFDDNLGQVLIRCGRLWNEEALVRLRTVPGFENVSDAQVRVLAYVSVEGDRLSEIAKRMEVSKQAVQKLILPLLQRGVLYQKPDPRDGRAKLICLDVRDNAEVFRGLALLRDVEREVAQELGEERMKRLHSLLLEVMKTLETMSGNR